MRKIHHWNSGSPLPERRNRLSTAVNAMMGRIGLMLRAMSLSGIFDIPYSSARNTVEIASPSGFEPMNSITMYAMVRRIFTRGSIVCTGELPGKCWPMVISLSMRSLLPAWLSPRARS